MVTVYHQTFSILLIHMCLYLPEHYLVFCCFSSLKVGLFALFTLCYVEKAFKPYSLLQKEQQQLILWFWPVKRGKINLDGFPFSLQAGAE